MSDKHYIYGRVRLGDAASNFLKYAGGVGYASEGGDVEFTLAVYAENRDEAQRIVEVARATATEFGYLADDLERYIDCHDFSKPGNARQPEAEEAAGVVAGAGARSEYEKLPEPRNS